jgi:polysaccharide deacetylase 2 family uncharacterized protein YibQ
MAQSSRPRSRKKRSQKDWTILAAVGAALVILVSLVWHLVGQQPATSSDDFGARLYELASQRGVALDRISADQPIRKIDGVFVRSWQIGAPNHTAMRALVEDIVREAKGWDGRINDPPVISGDTAHLRLDLGVEAFDVQFVVAESRRLAEAKPTPKPTAKPQPTATPRPKPSADARGRLAILLDDAGQNTDLLARATQLHEAVGVAVLPFLPSSAEVAAEMHRAGHEIWLHLPMEPEGYPGNDPGPGAVFVEMSDREIRETVHAAINNVPHVVGVNNHMGSRATADLRTMTWVMQELAARGMAFIDSRTTIRTVAEDAARSQGVKVARRHVFLDNERSAAAIRRQLDEAVYRSRLDGYAIAIGHLDPVTVGVLEEEIHKLSKRSVDIVRPSVLVR